ncbi:uncharacterized protein LOC113519093 [Galleria mellonella]|uniref:Uncharacterized protein LOC113519093 n=1 Tax=Galleria mellonella TaxID=7137 RepID=A0A6J1WVD4_GALME|nr:uncharacterized protein LOC113519093 [Galleria mellonella]
MMIYKVVSLLCLLLFISNTAAFVKRDVSTPQPNVLQSMQKNVEEFKKCVDLALANSVNQISTEQLQPILNVIGDQVNRFSKAFQDLTATNTPTTTNTN